MDNQMDEEQYEEGGGEEQYGEEMAQEEAAPQDPFLYTLTSQAPWWLVSVVFHVLLIVLAYMFSIAINLDTDEREPLVTVTQLTRPVDPVDDKKPKEEMKTASDVRSRHACDRPDVQRNVHDRSPAGHFEAS